MTGSFYRSVVAEAGDIDRMRHVNNSVYLRWIEAVVYGHWEAMATASELAAFAWVAVRHEIDYRRPAFIGDTLSVSTRIVEIRRARAWYETAILQDGVTLVDAKSCWCCIDVATTSLTAIPPATARRFLESDERVR